MAKLETADLENDWKENRHVLRVQCAKKTDKSIFIAKRTKNFTDFTKSHDK